MKRGMKALRQLREKSKKRSVDDGESDRSDTSSFDRALSHLQQSLAHLDTLGHTFILSLRDSNQERLQSYSRTYDLSRSERSKVQALAVTMATDGQPLEQIGELLSIAVGNLDLSIKTVLQVAVEKVVSALRYKLLLLSPSFSLSPLFLTLPSFSSPLSSSFSSHLSSSLSLVVYIVIV
uniref:NBAS subunit of NRZ tethering complex C-terminal domain-containing protein n=1 Tax=Hucho hucho TaxID=62062 RepID=A0A4W5KFS8_9TELE